jgi:hypothetical protein
VTDDEDATPSERIGWTFRNSPAFKQVNRDLAELFKDAQPTINAAMKHIMASPEMQAATERMAQSARAALQGSLDALVQTQGTQAIAAVGTPVIKTGADFATAVEAIDSRRGSLLGAL